jgi:hypothetical protein
MEELGYVLYAVHSHRCLLVSTQHPCGGSAVRHSICSAHWNSNRWSTAWPGIPLVEAYRLYFGKGYCSKSILLPLTRMDYRPKGGRFRGSRCVVMDENIYGGAEGIAVCIANVMHSVYIVHF